MTTISRKTTLPIVCCVCFLTLLIAGYTYVSLDWFLDYYDFYERKEGGVTYPLAVTLFHRWYLIGLPAGLGILGYGLHLLRPSEQVADRIAWFVAVSIGLVATWFLWTQLVVRSFYEQFLFPA